MARDVTLMPFTPFHLGPRLLFGLLLFSFIDFPTFLVASVIVDIEPFLVLTLNLHYPLHGFFHSFLGGTLLAFLLAAVMSKMRNVFSPLMLFFKLEQKPSLKSVFSASLFGIYLHILLDSPLYLDIKPFYPFDFNPLLSQSMFIDYGIYTLCVLSFIGGGVIYAIRLVSQIKSHINKRMLIILSFSLICLASIIGGLWYWQSEQGAEQRLQEYIERLEDAGFTVDEHSLADFNVDGVVRIHFFGDFRSYAEQEGINHVYVDRGIYALYFLNPITGDGVEANLFYYK